MSDDTLGRRFLVVEDEAMIVMLVEDILEDLGHELHGSSPGAMIPVGSGYWLPSYTVGRPVDLSGTTVAALQS